MRSTKIFLTGAAIMLAALVNTANAQFSKGEIVVTGGAGFSASGLYVRVISSALEMAAGSKFNVTNTPALLGSIDYGITKNFSVGGAYSYQSFTFNFQEVPYVTVQGRDTIGTWKDKLMRSNAGIRLLFHTSAGGPEGDGPEGTGFDMYGGMRIGYLVWNYKSYNTDPDYPLNTFYDQVKAFRKRPTFQLVGGARYFFTENIGINAEVALGAPYFAMAGVNFKFGTAQE